MSIAKRFSRILLLVLLLGGMGLAVLYYLSARHPTGYFPRLLTAAEREAAAKRLELDKLPQLLNLANQAQANAASAHRAEVRGEAAPAASTRPIAPVTVTFTQDEINASLWKQVERYKSTYERYLNEPYVSLEEGTIVLMGHVPEYGRVASASFEPRLDDKGMLRCDLTSLKLGSLPLPEGLLSKQRSKVENALRSRLPEWQNRADIGPTGVINADGRAAALSQLVLRILSHQPSPAVVFLPKDIQKMSEKGSVPVKLTNVGVEKGALTVTIEPMTADERAALLETIREPQKATPAPQSSASAELSQE
jgi:uncharacterized protein YpmS